MGGWLQDYTSMSVARLAVLNPDSGQFEKVACSQNSRPGCVGLREF